MTLKELLLTLGSTALLSACSPQISDLPVMDISCNVSIANTTDTASVISLTMAFIPEATDSTLISYPHLAGILNGKYYLDSNGVLMVFDRNGKCVSSANRVGQGPEEYVAYAGALANKTNDGWVVTAYPFGVKSYTSDVKYISTDTLTAMNNLKPLGNGWIATNNGLVEDTVKLFYYDSNFRLTDSITTEFKHRAYKVYGGINVLRCHLYSNGDDAFMVRNDTIFNVTDPRHGALPVAIARLSDRMVPEDLDMAAHPNWYEEYIEPEYIFGKDYVMVNFSSAPHHLTMQVYSLSTGKLVLSLSTEISKERPGIEMAYHDGVVFLRPMYYADGDRFYFYASDEQMIKMTGSEDANPGIFYLEIK